MFCPPRLPKLPPTKPIDAAPHQAPNSPIVSTNSTRQRCAAGSLPSSLFASGVSWLRRCHQYAAGVEQRRNFVKPLRMPRHEDQLQLGMRWRQAMEDVEGVLLLRLLRAAGEEDDVSLIEPGKLLQRDGSRIAAIRCALSNLSEPVAWTDSGRYRRVVGNASLSPHSLVAAIKSIRRKLWATNGRMRR